MTIAVYAADHDRLVLRTRPAIDLTDEQFFPFCQLNSPWRIERTADRNLEIMAPAGWETGSRNAIVVAQLTTWALRDGNGIASDSSGSSILPNSAVRSPDAAWVHRQRLDALSKEQRERFLPLCPDFMIELRSPSDTVASLQAKMDEYIANGALLGWLIDPIERRVQVYRPGIKPVTLDAPKSVSGESELSGFVLELEDIWRPPL